MSIFRKHVRGESNSCMGVRTLAAAHVSVLRRVAPALALLFALLAAWPVGVHLLAGRALDQLEARAAAAGLRLRRDSVEVGAFPPRMLVAGLQLETAAGSALLRVERVQLELDALSLLWPTRIELDQVRVDGAELWPGVREHRDGLWFVVAPDGDAWPRWTVDELHAEGHAYAGALLGIELERLRLTFMGGDPDRGEPGLWDVDAAFADGGTLSLHGRLDGQPGLSGGVLVENTRLAWIERELRLPPVVGRGHLKHAAGTFRWNADALALDRVVIEATGVTIPKAALSAGTVAASVDAMLPTAGSATLLADLELGRVRWSGVGPTAAPISAYLARLEGVDWADGELVIDRVRIDEPVWNASADDLVALWRHVGEQRLADAVTRIEARGGSLRLGADGLLLTGLDGNIEPGVGVAFDASASDASASDAGASDAGASDAGAGRVSVRVARARTATVLTIDTHAVPATLLSPMLVRAGGPGLDAGLSDVQLGLSVAAGHLDGRLGIGLQDVQVSPAAGRSTLLARDARLLLALLTDAAGHAEFEVPLTYAQARSADDLGRALLASLTGAVAAFTARPFKLLAPLAGMPELPQEIAFAPGEVAPDAAAGPVLSALVTVLRQRPRLRIDIAGGFDSESDRRMLAARQVRLHVALATRTERRFDAEPAPIDIADAKVRDVLDEFGSARLGAERLAALRAAHGEDDYYAALIAALEANEAVADSALDTLASYRARAVRRALLNAGIGAERVRVLRRTGAAGRAAARLQFGALGDASG